MSRANGEEPSFYQKYKNEKVKKNNFYTGFRKKASTPVNETYRENQFNQKSFPSLGNEKTELQTQPQGVWGQGKKFIPLTKPVVTNTTEVKVEEPKVVKPKVEEPKVEKTQVEEPKVEKVNGEKQLTLDSWLKSKVEPVKEEPKKVEQSNVQAPRMVQPKKFDVQEWAQKMKKHNPRPEPKLNIETDFPTLGSPIVSPVSMGVWGGNMSKVFAKPEPKKKEVPVEETTRISPGVYAIKKNRENDKHLSIQSKRMMNISSHFSSINNQYSDDEEPYEREEPSYSEPEEVEDDEDDEEDDDYY